MFIVVFLCQCTYTRSRALAVQISLLQLACSLSALPQSPCDTAATSGTRCHLKRILADVVCSSGWTVANCS